MTEQQPLPEVPNLETLRAQHQQAEQLRERGEYEEALVEYRAILPGYIDNEAWADATEAHRGMALTYKLMHQANPEEGWGMYSLSEATLAMAIARPHDVYDKVPLCMFSLGEAHRIIGNRQEAIAHYREGMHMFEEQNTGKLAEIAKNRYGLGAVLCSGGIHDEQGQREYEEGLQMLRDCVRTIDESRHTIGNGPDDPNVEHVWRVWQTGARMELARALARTDPREAYNVLEETVMMIVDGCTNPAPNGLRLEIRARQFNRLLVELAPFFNDANIDVGYLMY